MPVTRREFIGWGTAGLAGATLALRRSPAVQAAGAARFKVGITDWNLHLEGKVEAVARLKISVGEKACAMLSSLQGASRHSRESGNPGGKD